MTLNEFLEKLSKTMNGWKVTLLGGIRRGSQDTSYDCPISAVTGDQSDLLNADIAGVYKLGLRKDTARSIMWAADRSRGHSARMRAKLLAAVGLKEAP